jgi:folylpolyglutamate synthase/dihydropteroate synthase
MTSEVILSRAAHPRAHAFSDEEVQDYLKGKEVYRAQSAAAALQKALQMADVHDVVCVAGSLYLMADVRECFPFVAGRQNDGGRKDDVPI